MKRFTFAMMVSMVLVFAGSAFAGECQNKKCSADAQTCLNKMSTKLAQSSWDGIWVHEIKAGTDVVVRKVDEGSPGALAGIQEGDVLAAMNSTKLANLDPKAFYTAMSEVKIGQKVTYGVKRGDQWLKLAVTMTATPKEQAAKQIGWHMLTGHTKMGGETVASN